jgi:hypothetical protein
MKPSKSKSNKRLAASSAKEPDAKEPSKDKKRKLEVVKEDSLMNRYQLRVRRNI